MLEPTPDEEQALGRLRARENASLYGALLPLGLLTWGTLNGPALRGISPTVSFVVLGLALAAAGYGLWKFVRRGAIGPVLIRLSPGGAAKAGGTLGARVAIRPRKSIPLDPLMIRLVARGGSDKDHTILYESTRLLAEVVTLAEAEGAVFEAAFPIPADAPATSANPPVRWRAEVTMGRPPIFERSVVVRVEAPRQRRRRARVEGALEKESS